MLGVNWIDKYIENRDDCISATLTEDCYLVCYAERKYSEGIRGIGQKSCLQNVKNSTTRMG